MWKRYHEVREMFEIFKNPCSQRLKTCEKYVIEKTKPFRGEEFGLSQQYRKWNCCFIVFLQGLKSNWRTCTIRPWLLLVIFRSWTRSPKSPMESHLVPLSHCLWLRRPSKTRSIKIKVHWFQSDETQKTLHCSVVQIFKKFKAYCDWSKCTFYRLSNQNVPCCGRDATVVCRPSNQKRGGMYHTKTQASEFLSTNSLRYNLWYLTPLYNDDSYKERVDIITFILKNLLIKIWRLVRRHLYTYLYNTCM